MKRRSFIKEVVLLSAAPMLWLPRVKAQDRPGWNPAMLSRSNQNPHTAPPAGCSTTRDANIAASNGTTTCGAAPTNANVASFFTAGASTTICKADLYLAKLGSPTFDMFFSIWTDSGSDTPGTIIAECAFPVNSATLTTSEAAITFDLFGAAVTSGTRYWVVLRTSATVDVSNNVLWHRNSSGAGTNSVVASTSPAVTWNNVSSSRRGKFQLYS